ncbi:MAG: carboxypeptidase regulatory-like domain-containing protein, partial [Calditrichia bacterium]
QRVDGPPVAATHLDSTNNIAYLVVDSPYTTSTFITLWTLSDPLGSSPALSAVNIPITAALRPPDANQLGGGSPRIDSGRRAYRNAVYKDGNIWTATAIAGGSGNAYAFARYLRLDVDAHSAIEDVALGADGFYYLYPAIMVDEDDNMVMVFTRSGDSEYAGVAYTGRRDFDPPGLSPSVLLKPGEANYVKTFGGSRNRWGDYMGIALDPDNPNTIWGLIEFADSPANTWGTWVGAFTYQYMASGIVKDAQAGTPIEFANIEVVETGRVLETDSTGMYTLGSPSQNISLNITAFAYQDTTASLTLTLYNPDTLDILLEPEIEATISGQVKDSLTGTGIPAELAFYARGNPYPGPYVTTTTDPNGFYNVTTIIGTYDIVVTPEIPYPVTTINDVLLDPASLNLNIELLPADVFLINDDVATDNEIYFQEALDSVGATYFTWRISESGIPDSNTIALFPDPKTILWYTGNAEVSVLSDAEQQSLSRFLDNGGKLLLTGQNIAETSSSGVLLSNYLGVDFDTNINPPIIKGVDGDLLGDGLVLSTVGGAGNQNSKDAITVTGNAITSLNYGISTPIGIAGIRTESTPFNWKAVFFGFGLEGINNTDGKRDELLRRSLVWFDVLTGIGNQPQIISKNLPENFELEQNYPNPFNPSTTIKYHLAKAGDVVLLIYNQLGQQVKQLVAKRQPAGSYKVQWDGKDDSGKAVASGIYVYHLRTEDYRHTRKMILLK